MKVEVTCHSRQSKDNSGSKLLHQIFQIICQIKARPDINLFASRLLADLPWYVAWRPDPYSKKRVQCNKFGPIITLKLPHLFNEKQSFSKDWDKVQKWWLWLPTWQSQDWYPALLIMSIEKSILLPQHPCEIHSVMTSKTLRLAFWRISSEGCLRQDFQRELPTLFRIHWDNVYYQITFLSGQDWRSVKKCIYFDSL